MGAAQWKAKWIEPDLAGRHHALESRADAPRRLRARRARRVGARVRDGARPVRDGDQRTSSRHRGAHARLDELRHAAAVPDVRRHRRSFGAAPTPSASRSATAGGAAGWRGATAATRTARTSRCSRRSSCATAMAASRSSPPTNGGRPRRDRSSRRTSTTARSTTRGSSARDGASPATPTADWKGVRVASHPLQNVVAPLGPRDPSHRGAEARSRC